MFNSSVFLLQIFLYTPRLCPPSLFELMMCCWRRDIPDRPSFEGLYQALRPHVNQWAEAAGIFPLRQVRLSRDSFRTTLTQEGFVLERVTVGGNTLGAWQSCGQKVGLLHGKSSTSMRRDGDGNTNSWSTQRRNIWQIHPTFLSLPRSSLISCFSVSSLWPWHLLGPSDSFFSCCYGKSIFFPFLPKTGQTLHSL